MILKLRTKLILTYVMVALLLVAMISFLSNFLLDKQFKNYIMQNQSEITQNIISSLQTQYSEESKWYPMRVESIGSSAINNGYILKLSDADGNTVWDAKTHNEGKCNTILVQMANNMSSRYPGWKGKPETTSYVLKNNFKNIGTVEITYYGPYFYTQHDLDFLNSLNDILVGVGIFSIILSVLLGVFISSRISEPISKIMGVSHAIAKGRLDQRVTINTSTREIAQLGDNINYLANSLENQENLRKRLTADVAHELRTPLATLQSHMEALLDGIWEPTKERIESCYDEIIRINKMVGDLGNLTKYENAEVKLEKTEFSLSELINRIILNFESDFKKKNINITFKYENINIKADRNKISQVVFNLISNSHKYTPEGGKVEIEVTGHQGKVKILIKDNGVGISAEDLPFIFQRFYRADRSRNRLTGGAGIGLSIVKAIVEAHEGEIEVKSELAKGTEIIVTIPSNSSATF